MIEERDPTRSSASRARADDAIFEPPAARRGSVRRTRLLRLLRSASDLRVVSIVAPPGYGKTTALAQWAATNPRAVVWLTVEDRHNDRVALFIDLASTLERKQRVLAGTSELIGAGVPSGYALADRLLAAIGDRRAPVLLIVDDAHRLIDRSCLDALGEFIARSPATWQVALAGRDAIPLPLGRWRAQGTVLEIGVPDLAMDTREAAALLSRSRLTVPAATLQELVRASGGWPAIIYLATLRAARTGTASIPIVSGREPFIADYLRSEFFERRPEADIAFLTRTSILERLNGPLCDAVLELGGSGAVLARLGRSTPLLDESGEWFRYHSLLREFLRDELGRREPAIVPDLHRRAASWFAVHDLGDLAVEHAFASGDLDLAAAWVAEMALRYHWSGRRATVRGWIQRFSGPELERRPWLAFMGAMEEAGLGELPSTEHLADIVERSSSDGPWPDGALSIESGRAIMRAILCRNGAADMLANATEAVALVATGSSWRDLAVWALAFARLIGGDPEGADDVLADTVAVASTHGNVGTWQCALAQRALLAIDRGDWGAAIPLAEQAGILVADAHLEGYQITALTRAALARVAVHRGDVAAAKEQLARSTVLRPQLTATVPWLNVAALIALGRALLAVGDAGGARTLLVQANDVLRLRPDLGILRGQVAGLQEQVASLPISVRGASTLTAAELRVLAYLPLYLSFKEIGERIGIRASTVHSQATAIYGKLGASSRSEAVDSAIEAGLLEGLPSWASTSPIAVDAPRRTRA